MKRWVWLDQKLALLFSRWPFLADYYAGKLGQGVSGEIPWTPYTKDLKNSRVAIVTTAGVHLKSQKPFDLTSPEGDWTFRALPGKVAVKDLMISHSHYDHRDADQDINVVFPVERLEELAKEGVIFDLARVHFSFMGFIPKTEALIEETAPQVARELKSAGVDLILLTPA
jgi:D-proline reductase (dithiol) PrdB